MPESTTLAAALLVIGPIVGMIPVANPILIPVWSAPREVHLRIIGGHRRAWMLLNLGFGLATTATAAGLVILALDAGDGTGRGGALLAVAVGYALAGGLWCAVLAVRARVTPALADLVRDGRSTEPAETLLGAAQGGLFAGFVLATSAALTALGLTLLATGGIATAIAAFVAIVGAGTAAWLLLTGDVIPAVLYVPTLLLGIGLLAGWT